MLTVSSVLWDANDKTEWFSPPYDESWALKLFNGWRRNLTEAPRCVLFTDRQRELPGWIEQVVDPETGSNGYGDCVRPFVLNVPMIFTGLDTIITGNCDKLARYCFEADKIALPKHPYEDWSINGVVLCPAGWRRIFDEWRGENDMKWLRGFDHARIDDLWPGKVVSFKAHVDKRGLRDARVVYFHGQRKPPDIYDDYAWVRDHWR